jgi:transposase
MVGDKDIQVDFMYNSAPDPFVPEDHPLRRIRPLIDEQAIRRECAPLYSKVGRPSVPPEQLFLALLGGYIMGVRSDRRLVMELKCNMALKWFVGLQMTQKVWDASTFSQNRRRRFDKSGVLERLFDQTVRDAMEAGLVSRHVSADGTLVRANASFKSLEPIELTMDPEEYKKRLRSADRDDPDEPDDPGNRAVNFRGQKRSNRTHRSTTDPDSRLVSKGTSGTGAYPGYTVNAVMENRHRILLGVGAAIGHGSTVEENGCLDLLDRAKRRLKFRPRSVGADKGFFHARFIKGLLRRDAEPHIAPTKNGRRLWHRRVRMRIRGEPYRLSQRCRKKIEELYGEAKDWHRLRRFRRRGRLRVHQEVLMIGWVLNLKRLAKLVVPLPQEP